MTASDQFPTLPPAPGAGSGAPPPPPPPPPGPYGGPGYPMPQWTGAPQRNGMAVAALVLGLCSLLLFVTFIVPLLALIFGLLGAAKAKSSRGAVGGLGQARAGWILGVLGLAGFAAMIIAAASGAFDDGKQSVFELEVGSCYDLPLSTSDETTMIGELEKIPCDEPHNGELFFQGQLNPNRDREYPGDLDAALVEAGTRCLEPFEAYVGVGYRTSELEIFPVVADKLSWKATRGEYSCFVTLADGGETSESLKGANR